MFRVGRTPLRKSGWLSGLEEAPWLLYLSLLTGEMSECLPLVGVLDSVLEGKVNSQVCGRNM